MICVPEGPEIEASGMQPSHVHGQIVSFRAAVHEVDVLQRLWKELRDPLRIFVDLGMHVDVRRVPEGVHLIMERLVDLGMAVAHAHGHDPAEEIQVTVALVVPEPLHTSLGDVDRFLEVGYERRVQLRLAGLYDLVVGGQALQVLGLVCGGGHHGAGGGGGQQVCLYAMAKRERPAQLHRG